MTLHNTEQAVVPQRVDEAELKSVVSLVVYLSSLSVRYTPLTINVRIPIHHL